jgi:hypothetical protein
MTKKYRKTIDYMLVQYKNSLTGTPVYEAFQDIQIDWLVQFTSNCMRNAKISIVTITVVDSSFMVGMLMLLFQNAVETMRLLVKNYTHVGIKAAQHTYVLDCCVEDTKCV